MTPTVTGDICLQTPSNGVQTQVILEYYNNDHDVIATRPSVVRTGTAGSTSSASPGVA